MVPYGFNATEFEKDNDVICWVEENQIMTSPNLDNLDQLVIENVAVHGNKLIENLRQTAYTSESDPLFFGWQRGENTEQDWLDKVAEIRARHPYTQ